MIRLLFLCCLIMVATITAVASAQESAPQTVDETSRHLIVVTGVQGSPEFGEKFQRWSTQWISAGKSAGFRVTTIDGSDSERPCRLQLQDQLQEAADTVDELWLIMIGHGTFDGDKAKFNLVGEDVTADEIGEWLRPRKKLTVIVNCASSSAPFTSLLSGNNRVVVTSTKSGHEMSFSHFGEHLANAITSQDIDLDKDQQTSLLEAVVAASGKTNEFYESDSRLATEHALIEDNGDGRGTPVEWFRGIRVARVAKDGTPADGLRANQVFFATRGADAALPAELVKKRNDLEKQIEALRGQRSILTEDQYYQQLEFIMLELARLYITEPRTEDE